MHLRRIAKPKALQQPFRTACISDALPNQKRRQATLPHSMHLRHIANYKALQGSPYSAGQPSTAGNCWVTAMHSACLTACNCSQPHTDCCFTSSWNTPTHAAAAAAGTQSESPVHPLHPLLLLLLAHLIRGSQGCCQCCCCCSRCPHPSKRASSSHCCCCSRVTPCCCCCCRLTSWLRMLLPWR